MNDDADAYLAALDDARAERDQLHPHRPTLTIIDGGRAHDHSTQATPAPAAPTRAPLRAAPDRYLDDATRSLGHQRIAQLRTLIDHNRANRPTDPPPGGDPLDDLPRPEDPGTGPSLSETALARAIGRSEPAS
jgi:hypothetical protein